MLHMHYLYECFAWDCYEANFDRYDRVRALVKVQEKFWGLLFLSIWNFMMKHHKIITVTKALFYHINLCSGIIFPCPGAIFMC